jgi:hypothetical protein
VKPEKPSSTADRRRADRQVAANDVRMQLATDALEGRVDNISKTGVLFFSEGQLRVTVELVEDGHKVERHGRIVRAQRMRGDSVGWAVEFDVA